MRTPDFDTPHGSCPLPRPQWRAICDRYRVRDDRKAWSKLGLNLGLLLLSYLALFWVTRVSLVLALLPAISTALLLTQLFMLQHDMGHGSFFETERQNRWVGSLVGVLVATPFLEWTRSHAHHHKNAGHLGRRVIGDIYTMTVDEWRRAPLHTRLVYRVFRNPVTLLVVVPFWYFLVSQRVKGSVCPDFPRGRELASVVLTNLALVGLIFLLGSGFGWKAFLVTHAAMLVVGGAIGVWLFTMGHDFETAWYARDEDHYTFEDAALRGSSFCRMPGWLAWLLCDVGYHHVHHLDVRIPCYRLRECHDENPQLFAGVPSMSVGQSLRGLYRVKLYDQDAEVMVPFSAAGVRV